MGRNFSSGGWGRFIAWGQVDVRSAGKGAFLFPARLEFPDVPLAGGRDVDRVLPYSAEVPGESARRRKVVQLLLAEFRLVAAAGSVQPAHSEDLPPRQLLAVPLPSVLRIQAQPVSGEVGLHLLVRRQGDTLLAGVSAGVQPHGAPVGLLEPFGNEVFCSVPDQQAGPGLRDADALQRPGQDLLIDDQPGALAIDFAAVHVQEIPARRIVGRVAGILAHLGLGDVIVVTAGLSPELWISWVSAGHGLFRCRVSGVGCRVSGVGVRGGGGVGRGCLLYRRRRCGIRARCG
ncbi:hypothetical protein CMI47_04225 [Candidatus Pacearchaeota archaeon]|nr:hypothetical protein [Candidatus Pacearchaeota archaeon]